MPGCEEEDLSFLGPLMSDEVARAIAAGVHAAHAPFLQAVLGTCKDSRMS